MKRFLFPAVIVLLSVCISLFVITTLIPRSNVGWDEGVYLGWIYKSYKAMRTGDIISLLSHIKAQYNYPPLQTLLTSIPLLPFPFSIHAARISNLLWFPFTALLVYILGKTAVKKKGEETVGFISALFFLFSPMFIIFSTYTLKEFIGTTFTLITALLYLKARKTQKITYYVLTGVSLFLLFFEKFNYALIFGGTLAAESLIFFLITRSKKNLRSTLYLFGTFLLLFFGWFLIQGPRLIDVYFNNPYHASEWFRYTAQYAGKWDTLLFVPRTIAYTYAPSRIVGGIFLLCFFVSIVHLKQFPIRLFWIAVFVNTVFQTFIMSFNQQERYIITVMPFLFIISATVLYNIFSYVKKIQQKKVIYTIACVTCLLILPLSLDLVRLPTYVYKVSAVTFRSPSMNHKDFNDESVWYAYNTTIWPSDLPPDTANRQQDVIDFIVKNVDLSKDVQVAGRSDEFSPPFMDVAFEIAKDKGLSQSIPYTTFFATIETLSNSPFNTRNFRYFNAYTLQHVIQIKNDRTLTKLNEQRFNDMGVIVGIYAK